MPHEIIPPGRIKCFITGKLRKNALEEHHLLNIESVLNLMCVYGSRSYKDREMKV